MPATIDELRTNIEHEIAAVSADLCLKIKNWVQRLDFCQRAVVAMQNNSSFIHNGIERTFTGIKNFIISETVFVLFKNPFVALSLKNPLFKTFTPHSSFIKFKALIFKFLEKIHSYHNKAVFGNPTKLSKFFFKQVLIL